MAPRRRRATRGRGKSRRQRREDRSESSRARTSKSSRTKNVSSSKSLDLFRVIVFNIFSLWMFAFQTFCSWRKAWHSDYRIVSRSTLMKVFDMRILEMFRLRDDEIAEDIIDELPFISRIWNPLSIYLSRVGYALAIPNLEVKPYPEGSTMIERIVSRVSFFDRMMKQNQVKQVVVLDAEFDTRAYDDDLLNRHVDIIYELGRKALMKKKRKVFRSSGRDLSHVVYVPANLTDTDSDWGKNLVKNGYDPRKSTLFICEKTFYSYRSRLVEDVMGTISDFLAKNDNSCLVLDYYDAPSVRLRLFNLFIAPFCRTNVWFGIPKVDKKNGRKSAEKWVKGFSLSVVEHVRMDKCGYGFLQIAASNGRDGESSSSDSSSESGSESSSSSSSDSDSDSDSSFSSSDSD
mmetsp:Transcript_13085/g.15248  ORF Transcript_13085/g.15248 Transcript_13085/m.15248 type:complete len:403 (+) Transcript_13085:275-1483(+)